MSVVNLTSGTSYATLSDAIAASSARDVIQISAGNYTENFPDITHDLTIQCVSGMAYLTNPQPIPLNGRAIMNVPADLNVNLTLYGLDISGAVDDYARSNGAGILFETGNGALVVSHSHIHDNQDGILVGHTDSHDPGGMTVQIDHSEIDHNGVAPSNPRYGLDHNVYIGNVTQATITDSYIHDALGGHEIKSRANSTTITNNRIFDGPTAISSYSIDLPDGGVGVISNNVIEKGPNSPNRYVVHYGGEGTLPGSNLQVTSNTLIDDRGGSGSTAVFVQTRDGGSGGLPPVTVTGNAFYSLYPIAMVQDNAGTAPDVISGNSLIVGSGPALDTSSPINCFAEGTRIATEHSEIPVEALRVGDLVVSLEAGERVLRPIRWIGDRRIDLRRHPRPEQAAPVRILASAFGEGLPRRDLLVSPEHCLFVDGWLVPARLLINDMTITRDADARSVRYFHIELPRHSVLLAEGLPAESYLDTGNRAFFANAGPGLLLHPDLAGPDALTWPHDACAPLAVAADIVQPIWQGLADRARSLGHAERRVPASEDPRLRLEAGGTHIRPISDGIGWVRFMLAGAVDTVRIVSRSGRPSDVTPYLDDRRRLGVSIARIRFRSAENTVEIPADHPGLTDGWHCPERSGTALWRWTDGNAAVTVPPGLRGALWVELQVSAGTQYQLEPGGSDERVAA